MENQHRKIATYRELHQAEIDNINAVKALENAVGELVTSLEATLGTDLRPLAVARVHLQIGFMFLVRAIARPESAL